MSDVATPGKGDQQVMSRVSAFVLTLASSALDCTYVEDRRALIWNDESEG